MEPYQPSSGTEGIGFCENFCDQCLHERWSHFQEDNREEDKCDILTRAFVYEVRDAEYPREWVWQNNRPVCTAWQKWDWGTDDDRREPPEKPKPPDPDQFDMFPLYPCELDFEIKQREIQLS